ncbi:hypothetical protein L7F22_051002 [Adiantum nelumboides]|nr:hypothetical protein [Adiantum nelumboides]
MPLEGCDVLLGMLWFYNHKAVLDSFKKTVTLEIRGRKIVLDVKLKGESVPLVSASANPKLMKQHISAYLIYVKESDETESFNLSSLDVSRRAFLDEYADCFSEALLDDILVNGISCVLVDGILDFILSAKAGSLYARVADVVATILKSVRIKDQRGLLVCMSRNACLLYRSQALRGSQAVGCKMKSPARGLSRHKTIGKGTMFDSELELQDQTPPTNQLMTQSSPSKVEVKVKAMPGTMECIASNSKQSTNSSKALKYPRLSKFYFSAEEMHEEYGLTLEGKLPKELSYKDIPDEEWLSVFKCLHKKNTKLFLNHVRDQFVNECWLLYQKVYQATPSNGELLAKFARGFVYERCPAVASDPIGHRIAWARFGGSVLENGMMQIGGLERKINKFCTDYGLTGVIQIEASICDGALSSIPTMSASKLQPFQGVGPAKQGAGGAQDLTQFRFMGGRPQRETNADKSSHVPELYENITELLKLDESNIELSEGFQHGKAVVKSGDRVEELEAEPFMVENHGKETIRQDSSKLSTNNQEGSLEIANKVEDVEDVETLLIIADTLRKKRKRQQEEGVHHPDPKKITNQDPPKTRAH